MMMKKYNKFKMFGLRALSVFINLLPLVIALIINWEICTKTRREGVALSVTGIVWIIVLIVSLTNAVPKKVNRLISLSLFFVIIYLMKPLLNYMVLFVGAALLGAILDELLARPAIKRYEELRVATKTADMTTQQVKEGVREVVEELIKQKRSGRV